MIFLLGVNGLNKKLPHLSLATLARYGSYRRCRVVGSVGIRHTTAYTGGINDSPFGGGENDDGHSSADTTGNKPKSHVMMLPLA